MIVKAIPAAARHGARVHASGAPRARAGRAPVDGAAQRTRLPSAQEQAARVPRRQFASGPASAFEKVTFQLQESWTYFILLAVSSKL